MSEAIYLGVSDAYLGASKVDRGGRVSAVMDRVRRTLLELLPHDNPPDQRHATEHVW